MSALSENKSLKNWLLLVILSYTAFIFNTTEFVPIGLLSDIARDFGMREANASILISVYAGFVAVMSLPLVIIIGRCDFRKILLFVLAGFMLSHFLSSVASNFTVLLISRLGVACSHAIFWSIVSPLAVHIAPKDKKETALGMIITGTSLAMIAGMPLGRVIGLHLGWRYTFGVIGIAALLALVLLAFLFPPVPNKQSTSVKNLPSLFKSPAITGIYIFTLLVVTAHYTGYSYIEPFLKQVAGLSDSMTTLSLTIFGISGIVASTIFSKFYNERRKLFLLSVAIGLPLILLAMRPVAYGHYFSMAHCFLWGLAIMAINLITEFEIIRFAPQQATLAISIYSSIYNVGIGCGAAVGSIAITGLSISSIGYAGGIIAIAALAFGLGRMIPALGNIRAYAVSRHKHAA